MKPESLEKLVSWKMPFGKHSGTELVDLPGKEKLAFHEVPMVIFGGFVRNLPSTIR